ncbi:MAG: SDR family oxidoreductase [Bacteroidia bacterium]|nr:SDR family oxidoreductase [Bacteroidia bacterium]
MKFNNKVVWITGASSGIGEALAYEFAKQDAVLILSSNMENELEQVKINCLKYCKKCYTIPFDIAYPEQIRSATDKVLSGFDRIDFLINNAGVSQRSLVMETPIEIDRKIMEINYFGSVILTKNILPVMVKNGGHIVVISSITGKFGFPLRSAYAASKHALYGFFESVRTELEEKNIRVTMVAPGRIRTNISVNALTKDGSAYGIMDRGQNTGIGVEKCAKKILKAINNNKKEAYIGGKEIILVYLKRYIPFLFYKIVSKVMPV